MEVWRQVEAHRSPWNAPEDAHSADVECDNASCSPSKQREAENLSTWRATVPRSLAADFAAAAATPTQPVDVALTFATHTFKTRRGRTIGYRVMGMGPEGGPPVLCLHGLSLHGGMFQALAASLASRGYRVIALDFFGRGASPWPFPSISGCSAAMLCRQVVELLAFLSIDAVELVIGHSMGGGVALALAARHPRRVRRVLATAPVGLPRFVGRSFAFPGSLRRLLYSRSFKLGKALSYRYWIASGRAAAIARGQADDFLNVDVHRTDAAFQVDLAADNLGADCSGFVDAWLSTLRSFPLGYGAPAGDLLRDYETVGRRRDLPVTLIWGEHDVTCPLGKAGAALVRTVIPQVELVVLPHAAHAVIFEEASRVEAEALRLLSKDWTPLLNFDAAASAATAVENVATKLLEHQHTVPVGASTPLSSASTPSQDEEALWSQLNLKPLEC